MNEIQCSQPHVEFHPRRMFYMTHPSKKANNRDLYFALALNQRSYIIIFYYSRVCPPVSCSINLYHLCSYTFRLWMVFGWYIWSSKIFIAAFRYVYVVFAEMHTQKDHMLPPTCNYPHKRKCVIITSWNEVNYQNWGWWSIYTVQKFYATVIHIWVAIKNTLEGFFCKC